MCHPILSFIPAQLSWGFIKKKTYAIVFNVAIDESNNARLKKGKCNRDDKWKIYPLTDDAIDVSFEFLHPIPLSVQLDTKASPKM